MKTTITPTGIELLLPVVPRGVTDIHIARVKQKAELRWTRQLLWESPYPTIGEGTYKLLGSLSFKDGQIVPSDDFDFQTVLGLDFAPAEIDTGEESAMTIGDYVDQIEAWLTSIGMYWVNPYGEREPKRGFGGQDDETMNFFAQELKQWRAAESLKLREDQMIVVIQIL